MGAVAKVSDYKMLSSLSPLNKLDADKCNELIQKSTCRQFQAGERLYKLQNENHHLFYLIAGSVEHIQGGKKSLLKASTSPLSEMDSNSSQLIAKTPGTLFIVDKDLLDLLLNWGNDNAYEVDEISNDHEGDWMQGVLQNPALVKLSATNIQAIMACIQTVPVKSGQRVIKQGERDNYYYIISKGRCQVSKKHRNNKETVLAELAAGDSFGEEALIADTVRSASITMLEDGMLLRLDQQDFTQFLKNKIVACIASARAHKIIEEGGQWIDVRSSEEYLQTGIGINMPLETTRIIANELNQQRPYVLFCNDARRSSVAAFLLSQRGFEVYVLEGGLAKNPLSAPAQDATSEQTNLYYLKPQQADLTELTALRKKEESYVVKIETLEAELVNAKKQSLAETKELENSLVASKRELEKYAKIHASFKQQAAEQTTRYAALEKRLEQSLSSLTELKKVSAEKEAALESLKASHNQALETLSNEQKTNQASHEKSSRLEHELGALQQANQQLHTELTRLYQSDEENSQRIVALENELKTHSEQAAQLNIQRSQYQQTITTLEDALAQSETKQAALSGTITTLETHISELSKQLSQKDARDETLRTANAQLQNTIDGLTARLDQLNGETTKHQQTMAALEERLTQSEAERTSQSGTIQTLETRLTELSAKPTQHDNGDHEALYATNEKLQNTIAELTARVEQLNASNTLANQQLATDAVHYKQTISALETALTSTNASHGALTQNIQTLESRVSELTRQLSQQNKGKESLEQQLEHVTEQLLHLTQRAELAEQTVDVLEFQLNRQQQLDDTVR